MPNMRAALYSRVSTTDQNNAIQVRELSENVERRRWELVGTYQDTISGAKASRPGLERLMTHARPRQFDAVVVYKLESWGRSLVHCVTGIQELQSLGIRFVAVSQGLDTDQSSPTAALLMHILAAVAQFERELIRERVAGGIEAAQKNGTRIGRPKVVFDRAQVIERRAAGESWRDIASALKVGVGRPCVGILSHSRDNAFKNATTAAPKASVRHANWRVRALRSRPGSPVGLG
jgi:DNA invertase Pin-like site-specific DNA recombinase